MFRFLLRSIGFVLLAAAFAALVVDGTRSIAAQQILQFSSGDTLNWMLPTRMAQVLQALEHGKMAALRPFIAVLLTVPTWMVTAVLGLLFLVAGRRPRPRIGYAGRF